MLINIFNLNNCGRDQRQGSKIIFYFRYYLFCLAFVLFFVLSAQAERADSSKTSSSNEISNEIRNDFLKQSGTQNSDWHYSSFLRFEDMEYATSNVTPDSKDNRASNRLLMVRGTLDYNRSIFDFRSEFLGYSYFSMGPTDVYVPQLYLGLGLGLGSAQHSFSSKEDTSKSSSQTDNSDFYFKNNFKNPTYRTSERSLEFSFGRKKHEWSRVDALWNLGLWEPAMTYDGLRPEPLGLIGYFFEAKALGLDLTLMWSPLYVPSLGPDIKEDSDGSLKTSSRWYRTPMQQVELFGNMNKVRYNLDIPPQSKMLPVSWSPSFPLSIAQ